MVPTRPLGINFDLYLKTAFPGDMELLGFSYFYIDNFWKKIFQNFSMIFLRCHLRCSPAKLNYFYPIKSSWNLDWCSILACFIVNKIRPSKKSKFRVFLSISCFAIALYYSKSNRIAKNDPIDIKFIQEKCFEGFFLIRKIKVAKK